jgi:hypothetical protein
MKLMIASELGSTGALAMLVFHRLLVRKGTNPFRLPSGPNEIPLQGLPWAETAIVRSKRLAARNRR